MTVVTVSENCTYVLIVPETPGSDVRTRPGQYSETEEMYPMDFKPSWKTAAYKRANEVVEGAYP